MPVFSRHGCLAGAMAALRAASAGAPNSALFPAAAAAFYASPAILRVERRTVAALCQPANASDALQFDAGSAAATRAGRWLRVRLVSRAEPRTLIHWLGRLPPISRDVIAALLPAQQSGHHREHGLAPGMPGACWMRADAPQGLMAALIIGIRAGMHRADQAVIMLVHDRDFRCKPREEILARLLDAEGTGMPDRLGAAGMPTGGNEVEYDAGSGNDQTPRYPAAYGVESGGAAAAALRIARRQPAGVGIAFDGSPFRRRKPPKVHSGRRGKSTGDARERACRSAWPAAPERAAEPLNAAISRRLVEGRQEFLRFLRRRLDRREDAEDVLQDFCLKALSAAETLVDGGKIDAWLGCILRNTLNDHYRRGAAWRRAEAAIGRETQEIGIEAQPDEIREPCGCLHRALPALRPDYAEILRRADLNEELRERIAAELGLTVNNVGVRLHRARRALREKLQEICPACRDGEFPGCGREPAVKTGDRLGGRPAGA